MSAPAVPGVMGSGESVPTAHLARAVAQSVRPEAGVTDNGPIVRSGRVEAESATNGTRAGRVGRDHPTVSLAVTATVNAGVDLQKAMEATVPTAGALARGAQAARAAPVAIAAVPVARTLSGGARGAVAPVNVTGRAGVVASEVRGMRAAASVPSVEVRGMRGAASVPSVGVAVLARVVAMVDRTVLAATVSAREATVTVSGPAGRPADGTATAVSVPSAAELVTESAPSVRSAGARVAGAVSSAVGIGSRGVTSGEGATTRDDPTVRAMATVTVDADVTTAAEGMTPCGRATGARLAEIVMPALTKKS